MSSGWICLHRKLLEWEWYNDTNTVRLFLHLLLKANHKDKQWRGKTIKAGSFITGRIKLADETGLSESQIRTSLNKLKSTGEITIKASNKDSTVTLVNWASYQNSSGEMTNKTASNSSDESPTNRQQIATTNNVNNEKNENKRDTTSKSAKADHSPVSELFDFWVNTMKKDSSKTKLTKKRKTAIANRLKEGYLPEDIRTAITKCSQSDFHMGLNDQSTQYNDIELICRSGEKLESFRDRITNQSPKPLNNNGTPSRKNEFIPGAHHD